MSFYNARLYSSNPHFSHYSENINESTIHELYVFGIVESYLNEIPIWNKILSLGSLFAYSIKTYLILFEQFYWFDLEST